MNRHEVSGEKGAKILRLHICSVSCRIAMLPALQKVTPEGLHSAMILKADFVMLLDGMLLLN